MQGSGTISAESAIIAAYLKMHFHVGATQYFSTVIHVSFLTEIHVLCDYINVLFPTNHGVKRVIDFEEISAKILL